MCLNLTFCYFFRSFSFCLIWFVTRIWFAFTHGREYFPWIRHDSAASLTFHQRDMRQDLAQEAKCQSSRRSAFARKARSSRATCLDEKLLRKFHKKSFFDGWGQVKSGQITSMALWPLGHFYDSIFDGLWPLPHTSPHFFRSTPLRL